MIPGLGMTELVIILVIALIIFGPRKLPELGKSLGKSIGEFRKASNELKTTLEEEIRVEEQKEQKAKIEAEQQTAVDAGSSHQAMGWMADAQARTAPADEVSPAETPAVPAEPTEPTEPTVSRTGSGSV
jgi:TatA/E family protein of Tat protein translocase